LNQKIELFQIAFLKQRKYINSNDRLAEMERNMIDRNKYINKELNLLNFIEKKMQDYEALFKLSKENELSDVSTKYSDKDKHENILPSLCSFVDENQGQKVSKKDSKPSFRSTYAYMNQCSDYHGLEMEHKIREMKEQELAEKRYQLETVKYLLDYGEKKGKQITKYNNMLEKKLMMKNSSIDDYERKKLLTKTTTAIIRIYRDDKDNEIKHESIIMPSKYGNLKNVGSVNANLQNNDEKDENIFDIKCQQEFYDMQENSCFAHLRDDIDHSEISNINNRDNIFRTRHIYGSILDSKMEEPSKSEDSNTLSLYDDKNIKLTINKLFSIPEESDKKMRFSKSIEIRKNRFVKNKSVNDLLEQRTIYSKYIKNKDNYKMKSSIEKEEFSKIQLSKINNGYLPPIESKETINRFYLPIPGMCLKETSK